MKTPVLQLDNVSKTFYPPLSFRDIIRFNFKNKPPAQALDNVSFQLEEGKVLGILGPNGAGKTTLLKIISTLILPDSGKVRVNSYEVNRDDDNIKRSLGLASSEERSFYWRLTGIQNLEFFAAMYGLNKNQARARIKELFETFHINYGRKRFDTYSAGMKRIFLIIRALLHNPRLLLLDEPSKSLDFENSQKIRDFIVQLSRQGKTILLATHNFTEATELSDSLLILYQGRNCAWGTMNELRHRFNRPQGSIADIYKDCTCNA